jgi:cytosine deaminase
LIHFSPVGWLGKSLVKSGDAIPIPKPDYRLRLTRKYAVTGFNVFAVYKFRKNMDKNFETAIEAAKKGMAEGGIPIGSVLEIDGKIVGSGHNQRVQKGSAILHAEMDCLENAGRLKASDYRRATLYTTLSPCDMCSGTILLYGIPKVVIGENRTFRGPENYLRSRGVELVILDNEECRQLMETFIKNNPALWNEDIGE